MRAILASSRRSSKPSTAKPAHSLSLLLPQLAAAGYDGVVLVAMLALSGLLAQFLTHGQLFDAHGHLHYGWYRPVQAMVVGSYLVLSWRYGGQTLGLRAWRLQLRSRWQPARRWWPWLWRWLLWMAPWLALGLATRVGAMPAVAVLVGGWLLSYARCALCSDRRSLHDWLAGTELVRLPRQPRNVNANP